MPGTATAIRIRGQVQGVGFRPFVWRLATGLGISGEVWNDDEGVMIHAWGDDATLKTFQNRMRAEIPPLARIDAMECAPLADVSSPTAFSIAGSRKQGHTGASVTPDAAICPHCMRDILNPADRHYGYPFTSCTHCGPRLSIVHSRPYDRANTSMAPFVMCQDCEAEYRQPADRRFHAQTNACPACGPRLWLEDAAGKPIELAGEQVIERTANLLREGCIVAIKGIGGIHLAVDAGNNAAVERLRSRKQRDARPFALMAPDISSIARHARLNATEELALCSTAAPIVLLDRKPDRKQLATAIAPGQSRLGFMLPYSPLHALLMRRIDRPIVLTSGNRSDEPQCIGNAEARERLAGIADYLLLHDRDIINRLDDSVTVVMNHELRLLRRARGHAPAALTLHEGFSAAQPVLGMGGELKNTFCQLAGGQATVSQHIGDLENAAAHADYRRALDLYARLFDFSPRAIAVDMHPDYLSGHLGRQMAREAGLALIRVQHHHAHVAAVLAEHGFDPDCPPVMGIALDGLGLGPDGTLWGGEFLRVGFTGFERLGCFRPMPMPGGAQAIRQPWRNTYAHLHASGWEKLARQFRETDIVRLISDKPLQTLHGMIEGRVNSPLSSSCGRLFDAVAAALGICSDSVSYEGQAAIELEALAQSAFSDELAPYPYRLDNRTDGLAHIDWRPMWPALLADIQGKVPAPLIAARFHCCVANAVAELATILCQRHDLQTVVLCGGCFQNRLLLEPVASRLMETGLKVLIPGQMPAGDGGLALGQAAVCAARLLKGDTPDD